MFYNYSQRPKYTPTHCTHLQLWLRCKQKNDLIPTLLSSDAICVPRAYSGMLFDRHPLLAIFFFSLLCYEWVQKLKVMKTLRHVFQKIKTRKKLIMGDQAQLSFTGAWTRKIQYWPYHCKETCARTLFHISIFFIQRKCPSMSVCIFIWASV